MTTKKRLLHRACLRLKGRRVLSAALDFIPDAVFAIDTQGRVFLWNKSIETMTGIPKEQIIGLGSYTHSLCFHNVRRPLLVDLVLNPDPSYESKYINFSRSGDTAQGEFYAAKVQGGLGVHLWSRASTLYDKRGKLIGAIQTISDISSRVEQHAKLEALNVEFHAANQELAAANEQLTAMEEELRYQYEEVLATRTGLEQAHQQLANIIDHLPDATFVIDPDKKVIAWNREMESMTGVRKHDVLGTSDYSVALYGQRRPVLVDFVGMSEEEVRKHYRTDFRRMEQQVIHNEGFMPRAYGGKGAYLSVMAASMLDGSGKVVGAIESLRDITASRENELALHRNEALLRELTDHMHDVVLRLTPAGVVDYASPSVKTLAGYTIEQIIGRHFSDFIHPDDLPLAYAGLESLETGAEDVALELRISYSDGHYRYVESVGSPIRHEDGSISGVVYVLRDITERKRLEQSLRHLGLHDHLTQAYNRAYFEQQLVSMEQETFFPLGIVTCDIDGLKLVNDTLGHAAGDTLLQIAVLTLQSNLRSEDILARVGGDELAIIMPRTSDTEIRKTCAEIRQALVNYNEMHPELPLSMSLGYAFAVEPTPLHQLFEAADNSMYREKLHRQQSTRSSVVHTLMRALEARDFITEGHAERLQSLVVNLAQRVGLPPGIIADLRLLAQFHDIGKVGVPDRILFKPNKLTPDEWMEMRRHCEIGNRIAQASPDLMPIADWILKHHEWWDGSGYPLGLMGEDIPLECRIISIADAYDAMTNDRPYRKAMTAQEALVELKRGSGTQFDPRLVAEFLDMIEV